MSARLISLLVAGGVVLGGSPGAFLAAAASKQESSLPVATLQGATHQTMPGQGIDLDLVIPSFAGKPRLQVLDNPRRIVVDLPGVNRGVELTRKEMASWNCELIQKSRISQFAIAPEPVTRLVLEVAQGTQVTVMPRTGGLRISLSAGTGAVQAKLAPFSAEPEMAVAKQDILPAPPVAEVKAEPPVAAQAVAVASDSPKTSLSPIPEIGGSFQSLPTVVVSALMPTQPGQGKVPALSLGQMSRRDEGRGRTLGDGENRYTGTKMTIDVSGTDIQTFLKLIADTARLNLIVDQDVQGTGYTFKFTDVPWDQILDIIVKHAGLGKEISNGVIRVAKVEKLQKEEEDRKKLDEAKALAGELSTITRPLSFAKASEAKTVVKELLTKRGSLLIDDRTNTLIITDLPRQLTVVDELIQQMDVQIQQVQIEARVVEASGSYEKAFGVKWPQSNSGNVKIGTSTPWLGTDSVAWNSVNNRAKYDGNGNPIGNDTSIGWAPGKDGVTSIANPAGEFWVSFLSNRMSVNVILQALEKEGKVKIISTPKVVTQNNKKAKILAGEKIPYPSQQGGAAGGAITVAFVDANLQLDVTPQITNDGTILMDLKITKAQADFSRTVQGTPTILNKEIETQVLVKDGGTAILGGVYSNTNSNEVTGVPFLAKLPIIGWLFRSKSNSDANSELLIFITPRILKN